MKTGKGAKIVKQIASMVSRAAKSTFTAVATKSDAVKARILFKAFTVLSRRKNFSIESTRDKINDELEIDNNCNANAAVVVVYRGGDLSSTVDNSAGAGADDEDEKYPDLRHSLFDEEEEVLEDLLEESKSSAIDEVKNSKEDHGESFNLEDEINEVADLFINKFHNRMRLQKLLSFKRYQKMMERTA
ncbi:uncharacterized protein LOC127241325 [Andrographis paniculata]|uniref:uncharacterized protein LOC127241325 n=1 Tax=Andrographis paniculata TaxID=175694 RepID=UPI0021E92D2A|nr:uncharacterized protein LOC127241325 [Andrographis paniculata]